MFFGDRPCRQQRVGPAGDAAGPAPAAAVQPRRAVVSMEEPRPGDIGTYEVRDEISGTVRANRTNVVAEVTPTEISVRFKVEGGNNNEGINVYDDPGIWLTPGPGDSRPTMAAESAPRSRSARPGISIQQRQQRQWQHLETIGYVKGRRPGNRDYQGWDVRDVQNRNQLYSAKRQRPDQERRGHVPDLVRTCHRSLG